VTLSKATLDVQCCYAEFHFYCAAQFLIVILSIILPIVNLPNVIMVIVMAKWKEEIKIPAEYQIYNILYYNN
jgi:hypothetical protein